MAEATKHLYRIPKKGKIAGVCAGISEYFDVDVTIIRIIFALTAVFSGGAVVILYLLLAFFLPVLDIVNGHKVVDADVVGENKTEEKFERLGEDLRKSAAAGKARNFFGGFLLVFGTWLLLKQLFPQWFDWNWAIVWPALLIILGVLLIVRKRS